MSLAIVTALQALEGEGRVSYRIWEYRLGIWMTGDKALSHWCRSDYQQSVFEVESGDAQ